MTNARWQPMGQSEEDAATLHEGVPPWMEDSLWAWLTRALSHRQCGTTYFHIGLVQAYARVTRSREPLTGLLQDGGVPAFRNRWGSQEIVRFLDFCVARASAVDAVPSTKELEQILLESGSAWKVGTRDGFPGLERRVPEGVQEAAEHTMASAGDAGRRLSEAWHAAFGLSPNPSHAYRLAVLAVEDASKPVIAPNDRAATLGKMIGVVREQGDWTLPFAREDANAPTKDVLLGMMRALWAGQADRHGGDPDPALVITQEAAETAVLACCAVGAVVHVGGCRPSLSQGSARRPAVALPIAS